ncbi:hypothetical protein [Paenibacillus sabinae]|uniref:Phage protein n=1 Tax=Paenibacillus sabinae T27 TaxID=1268072 RepID=X4ZFA4_9BACL|nr:hypothetical protein [Paenibacillus sabinae]AHV96137.1 hypothetical protein PSAB_06005 [Paenibacillus sabinae T27]
MTQDKRDWQQEKYENLIKRCEMMKSYGETICVDPSAIISLIETAARADAAEDREQRLKEALEKIRDDCDPNDWYFGPLHKEINAILSTLYPDTPAPKEGE